MNILTKISVVVLVVLVLFASAVFITHANVTDNWKTATLNAEKKAELANQYAMNSLLALRRAQLSLDKASSELASSKAAHEADVRRLTAENGDLKTQLATAAGQIGDFSSDLKKLQNNLVVAQQQYTAEHGVVETLRKDLDQSNKQNLVLSNQVNQAEAAKTRYDMQIRSQQVTIQDLREQLQKAQEEKTQPAAASGAQAAISPSAVDVPKVTGQVTAVNGDVASVNIGSSKGIKAGTVLIIYRGAQLVGHLRVQEVDLSEAAGVVYDRKLEVKRGDQATTNVKL